MWTERLCLFLVFGVSVRTERGRGTETESCFDSCVGEHWTHTHTHTHTHTPMQVSVIAFFFSSGGYTFQKEFTPPWTVLADFVVHFWQRGREWERERERERGGKGREECCLWEEKEEGVSRRKEKLSQFLKVLLAVGYRMSAVAFLSVWEATASFSFSFFFFFFFFKFFHSFPLARHQ